MSKLSYVSLNLFYYLIKQGLGISKEQQQETYQELLKALPNHLETTIKASLSDDMKNKFVDFKNDKRTDGKGKGNDGKGIDLKFSGNLNGRQIEGVDRRSVLDDSYAILFDSYFAPEIELKQVPELITRDLRASIPPDETSEAKKLYWEKHFAHTWMVTACGRISDEEVSEKLAKEVYKDLTKKSVDWNQQNMSELEGIKIYEYWDFLSNSDDQDDQIEPNSHLLIILYKDKETMDKTAPILTKILLNILYHRNKIIWAYNNSRILKERLFTEYNESMAFRHLDQLSFKELKSLMTKLWEFNADFNTLKIQKNTIETNLHSYGKYVNVEYIKEQLPGMVTSSSWPDNLEKFGQYARDNYPQQIDKDVETLGESLSTLEKLKSPSKEIVEIKVAENTRQFQRIISIIGIGLPAASLTSIATKETFLKQLQGKLEPSCQYQSQPPKDALCLVEPDPRFVFVNNITGSPSWSLFLIGIFLCLVAGVTCSSLAALFFWLKKK